MDNSNTISRYVRQEIFAGLGKKGQEKIKKARVAIIEMSSIGAAVANNLARAGVGYIRAYRRRLYRNSRTSKTDDIH